MDPYVAQAIAAVAADHISGAGEIAEQSADVLLRQSRTHADGPDDLRRGLLEVGWQLIVGHPTMAPLVNLVNQVLWSSEQGASLREVRQQVAEAVTNFKRRLRVHEAAIAEKALTLLTEGAQVTTLGRSSTVRAALRHAQRAGRRFQVICAEGRPGYEGRAMATELAELGIPVKLVIDAKAIALASESQLVLVGADHLTARELVNKVGTFGLAAAAKASQVPVYTLCGSEKFMPHAYALPLQPRWPAEQVWEHAPENVAVENHSADRIPLSLITGIVTEQGILSTEGLESWMAAIKLHPALVGRG